MDRKITTYFDSSNKNFHFFLFNLPHVISTGAERNGEITGI